MASDIGGRLKELRDHFGLSQAEFASRIGQSRSGYGNYELGRSRPLQPIIKSICQTFHVRREWLEDGVGSMFADSSRTAELRIFCDSILKSKPEDFRRQVVTVLSRLSVEQWDVLATIAEELYRQDEARRSPESQQKSVPIIPIQKCYRVTLYNEAVGAGMGQESVDPVGEVVYLSKEPPPGTGFLLKISGDSMEPEYEPGDYVFVKKASRVDIGRVGIFSLNGEMLIKKYTEDGLESLNPNYDLIEIGEDDFLSCQGEVIGTATDDYFE